MSRSNVHRLTSLFCRATPPPWSADSAQLITPQREDAKFVAWVPEVLTVSTSDGDMMSPDDARAIAVMGTLRFEFCFLALAVEEWRAKKDKAQADKALEGVVAAMVELDGAIMKTLTTEER